MSLVPLVLAMAGVAPVAALPPARPMIGRGWLSEQAPGFYRFTLGAFHVTVLSDGTAARDYAKIMSKPAEVRAAYAAAHETLPTDVSINCFLIDTGSHRILVDTGAGELFGPGSGALVANMRLAGYEPGDIDTILLTHIHGDHSGGLSIRGERVFPNAAVYVDQRDVDHWLSRAEEARAPADHRTTFQQSRQTVSPYVTAGRLRTFVGATYLFPSVATIPEPGHTPGMTGYLVESQGQRLLLWGDIVHAEPVQFSDSAVTIDYDVDPHGAAATRARILAEAAREGYLIGGAHLSFPGIGHVRAAGKRHVWSPLPYRAKP